MNNEELCLALVKSNSESEIDSLLKKLGYLNDSSCWKNYGDMENNLSIIENQQARADTALVENLVNAADALLIGRCKREHIAPDDPNKAPKSIAEALKKYFKVDENDRLAAFSNRERTELAEHTSGLMTTGDYVNPCYSIFDLGEGQCPEDFEKTFLSLAKSNKLNVPFVQGKFNQGSTGVLRFARYKLILSRKDPLLTAASKNWGFTVIKKFPPVGNSKSSVYKYLAPKGSILSFNSESLPILPGPYPKAFGREMRYGTYVKLYEYDIGPALRTNIKFDLNYRLSTLLVEPLLPIRLYERRKYAGHTQETTLNGLELRLEDDPEENIEDGFPLGEIFTTSLGEFECRIYCLREEVNENNYSGKEGVIFTINGQSHGALPRTFFRKKRVNMEWLAKSLVVTLDCSKLSSYAVEKIFMPSRDRLVDCEATKEIESKLEDILSNNQILRELRTQRRQCHLEKQVSNDKLTSDIFQKIIKTSPILSKLLLTGIRISDPFSGNITKMGERSFEGKKHPTYFRILKQFPTSSPKLAEVGHKCRIQFETDVEDNYLIRQRYKGTFSLESSTPSIKFTKSLHILQGICTLNLDIPSIAQVGDIIEFKAQFGDRTLPEPFVQSFVIKIVHSNTGEKKPKVPFTRKLNPNDEKGDKSGKGGLALPNIVEIRESDWGRHDFDKYSALRVVSSGEGSYDFFINMDNQYLLTEEKNSKIEKVVLENRFKLSHVFVGVAILAEQKGTTIENETDQQNDEVTKEELILKVSRAISPVLLPLINNLSTLDSETVALE